MHPVLLHRRYLLAYAGGWLLFGALLTVALTGPSVDRWASGAFLLLPATLVYGFVCLAAWYPCRANPLGEVGPGRLVAVHLSGAAVSTALWQGVVWSWAETLDRLTPASGAARLYLEHLPVFLAAGGLLYLLAVAGNYLLLAYEAARRAASEALEARLLAQQAELAAFKAQIDPHFLFNCLNSISSLCGSDPAAARRTAIRLGEFLRSSLAMGSRDLIPLGRELELIGAYLDVESARFGDRLQYEEEVEPACLDRAVPALLLQPLVENALKHGVAHLTEDGRVRLEARLVGPRLRIRLTNRCEPGRPPGRGAGIGLDNVRGRLRLLYRDEAAISARDLGASYEVALDLPSAPSPAEGRA